MQFPDKFGRSMELGDEHSASPCERIATEMEVAVSQPRILLIEDNSITRKTVRCALENHGFAVSGAMNGKTALDLLASEHIELVLLDLILPDMDGFDLIGQLRSIPGATEIPMLALSGFLSKLEEARIAAVGFDDVIIKPIEPLRLLQIIRAYLPAPESSAVQFGRGRQLIVADDDAVQRKLACFHLNRLGFETTAAADGAEALEFARRMRPDAIVADVMMPNLDGFGLCVAIRQDEHLATVPVVLVTSNYVEEADRTLAYRAGADEFVVRTPEMHEIRDALRATLTGATRARSIVAVPTADLEQERTQRALKQLERQVLLKAGVAQHCATLSAEISILMGISEALSRQQDVDMVLSNILTACFDAGGISGGILYLNDAATSFRVHKFGSSWKWTDEELNSFFGHLDLLRSIVTSQKTTVLSPDVIADTQAHAVLAKSHMSAALVVPLVHGGHALGALVMIFKTTDLNSEGRVAFAEGVANQISAALTLANAFGEKDVSERTARAKATVLRSVLESIGDGVVVADWTGQCTLWNAAAETLVHLGVTGHAANRQPAHTGIFLSDMRSLCPIEQLPLVRAIAGENVDRVELFLRDDEAQEGRWLSVNARPLKDEHGLSRGGVAVFRDVTNEKTTQAQLMAADRMASIGILAAGVAHDINNPLTVVLANLDMAIHELTRLSSTLGHAVGLDELGDGLRDARDGAERVRLIVRDLRLLSQAEEDTRAVVDVQRVLDFSLRIGWNEIRHCARLVKDYHDVPPVDANESRLGQVFLNLILNAAQAIPTGHADRNEIRITTRTDAAGRVVVDIADTGPGIPPDVMSRLFTPFFTTKPAGIGTGLGLSICKRLVTAIGGTITVESIVGQGSVFHVVLPTAQPEAPEPVTDLSEMTRAPRRGRILVVDDEASIGRTIHRMLVGEHDVLVVTNAGDALQHIMQGERYDVILCDIMMPVMTGMDVHTELIDTAPDQAQRMIFLTGDAFPPSVRTFLDRTLNAHLEKPFTIQDLRMMVNDRLR